MRTFNRSFGTLNDSLSRSRRFVMQISFSDNAADDVYVRSHRDVAGLPGAVLDALLETVVTTTQRLHARDGRATIGSINFSAVDVGDTLTAVQRRRLLDEDKGLRWQTVRYWVGDERIAFDSFELFQTQIVQEVEARGDGVWRFKCSDVQRSARRDIFEMLQMHLVQPIDATTTTIPVDTTSPGGIPIQAMEHGPSFSDEQSGKWVYIQIDDEIVKVPESGVQPSQFINVTRGALGTRAAEHTTDETAGSERGKKVDEIAYLEMPVPKLAYALLTGNIIGSVETVPDNWHLGMPAEFVKLTEFQNIGPDWYDDTDDSGVIFRFVAPKAGSDGKRFVERELCLPLGAYMPVLADGQLGFRRMVSVLSGASAVAEIGDADLLEPPALAYRMRDIVNDLVIEWNDVLGEPSRQDRMVDVESQTRWQSSPVTTIQALGLHGSRFSRDTLVSLFISYRDRYAGPPIETSVAVRGNRTDLEIGDVVRLRSRHAGDFTAEPAVTELPGNIVSNAFLLTPDLSDWGAGGARVSTFAEGIPAHYGDFAYKIGQSLFSDILNDNADSNGWNVEIPVGDHYVFGIWALSTDSLSTILGFAGDGGHGTVVVPPGYRTLIEDGQFYYLGMPGWDIGGSNTLEIVDGRMVITAVNSTVAIQQQFRTVPGKRYRLGISLEKPAGATYSQAYAEIFYADTYERDGGAGNPNAGTIEEITVDFVASGYDPYLRILFAGGFQAGQTLSIASVRIYDPDEPPAWRFHKVIEYRDKSDRFMRFENRRDPAKDVFDGDVYLQGPHLQRHGTVEYAAARNVAAPGNVIDLDQSQALPNPYFTGQKPWRTQVDNVDDEGKATFDGAARLWTTPAVEATGIWQDIETTPGEWYQVTALVDLWLISLYADGRVFVGPDSDFANAIASAVIPAAVGAGGELSVGFQAVDSVTRINADFVPQSPTLFGNNPYAEFRYVQAGRMLPDGVSVVGSASNVAALVVDDVLRMTGTAAGNFYMQTATYDVTPGRHYRARIRAGYRNIVYRAQVYDANPVSLLTELEDIATSGNNDIPFVAPAGGQVFLRVRVDAANAGDEVDVARWFVEDTLDAIRSDSFRYHAVDRSFEVQGIRQDWARDRITLDLFGSTQPAGALEDQRIVVTNALPDSYYTSRPLAIDLNTLPEVSGGVVTSDLTLNGKPDFDLNTGNGTYYHDGDLSVPQGVTVTVTENVALLVLGVLTVDGAIDGNAQGIAGVADTVDTSGIPDYDAQDGPVDFTPQTGVAAFYGTTQGHGGIIERVKQRDNSSSKYRVQIQSLPAGVAVGEVDTVPAFQLEYNGANVVGLPRDLRGTSGGPGGLRYWNDENGGLTEINRGGTGGNGGAGLLVVARGMALGAAAIIDTSGGDGQPPALDEGNERPAWSGGGGGGAPGAVLVVVDGSLNPAPALSGAIIADYGVSPYPPEDDYNQLTDTWIRSNETRFGPPTVNKAFVPDRRFTADESMASGRQVGLAATRVQFLLPEIDHETDVDDDVLAGRQLISVDTVEAFSDRLDQGVTLLTATITEVDVTDSYSHANVYHLRTSGPDLPTAHTFIGPAEPALSFELPTDGHTYQIAVKPVLVNGIEAADFADTDIIGTTDKFGHPPPAVSAITLTAKNNAIDVACTIPAAVTGTEGDPETVEILRGLNADTDLGAATSLGRFPVGGDVLRFRFTDTGGWATGDQAFYHAITHNRYGESAPFPVSGPGVSIIVPPVTTTDLADESGGGLNDDKLLNSKVVSAKYNYGLNENPSFEKVDPLTGQPFGWRGYDAADNDNDAVVFYLDDREEFAVLYHPTDGQIRMINEAYPVVEHKRYTVIVRNRVRNTNSSSGFFLQAFCLNSDMPEGKRYIVPSAANSKPLRDDEILRDSEITLLNNIGLSTSWGTYRATLVIPAGVKYISLSTANWAGMGSRYLDHDYFGIVEQPSQRVTTSPDLGQLWNSNSISGAWPPGNPYVDYWAYFYRDGIQISQGRWRGTLNSATGNIDLILSSSVVGEALTATPTGSGTRSARYDVVHNASGKAVALTWLAQDVSSAGGTPK